MSGDAVQEQEQEQEMEIEKEVEKDEAPAANKDWQRDGEEPKPFPLTALAEPPKDGDAKGACRPEGGRIGAPC